MSNIEEAIRRAMEAGQFDNLPGMGQPLHLDENPLEDPEWRMAHHILRSSGFTLPWIETRREIELMTQTARTEIQRSWAWRKTALADHLTPSFIEAEWNRALELFRERVKEINQRIQNYNLDVPSIQFQLRLLSFEGELVLTISSPSDTLSGG